MDKHVAKKILIESILNLEKRRGTITSADLETEVINNACLAILRNQKEKMSKGKSLEEMFLAGLASTQDSVPISQAFTESAMELFPANYTAREAIMAAMGIQQNIAWEGMWDFLRDYFQKNHGIQIDDVETTSLIFYSTSHKRFENGVLVNEVKVERTINMSFIGEHEEIIVSIEPTLSPKKGYVIAKSESEMQFRGDDPDYLFTLKLDGFKEIDVFILEMPNRNLKIMYFD